MGDNDDKRLKLDALLEEYKAITADCQQYTQEAMKCFTYAAILVALYLGWGITGSSSETSNLVLKIQQYVPYGFVVLCVYFLAMVYVREGLVRYRAYLDNKINRLLGEPVIEWDSKYTLAIQERGYFQLGPAWYARVPTPPLFLGLIIIVASITVFTTDVIREQTIVVLFLLAACALMAIYVYLVYPRLIDRTFKDEISTVNPHSGGKKR